MLLDTNIDDKLNFKFNNRGKGENEKDSRTICNDHFYLYFIY